MKQTETFILEILSQSNIGYEKDKILSILNYKYQLKVELHEINDIIDDLINKSLIYYDDLSEKYKLINNSNTNKFDENLRLLKRFETEYRLNLDNENLQDIFCKIVVHKFSDDIPTIRSNFNSLYKNIHIFFRGFRDFFVSNHFSPLNSNITYRINDLTNKEYLTYFKYFSAFLKIENDRIYNFDKNLFNEFIINLSYKIGIIEKLIFYKRSYKKNMVSNGNLISIRGKDQVVIDETILNFLENYDKKFLSIDLAQFNYYDEINELILFHNEYDSLDEISNLSVTEFYSEQKNYLSEFLKCFQTIKAINNSICYQIKDFEKFKYEISFFSDLFVITKEDVEFKLYDVRVFKNFINDVKHKVDIINKFLGLKDINEDIYSNPFLLRYKRENIEVVRNELYDILNNSTEKLELNVLQYILTTRLKKIIDIDMIRSILMLLIDNIDYVLESNEAKFFINHALVNEPEVDVSQFQIQLIEFQNLNEEYKKKIEELELLNAKNISEIKELKEEISKWHEVSNKIQEINNILFQNVTKDYQLNNISNTINLDTITTIDNYNIEISFQKLNDPKFFKYKFFNTNSIQFKINQEFKNLIKIDEDFLKPILLLIISNQKDFHSNIESPIIKQFNLNLYEYYLDCAGY